MSEIVVALHQPNFLPYLGFFDKMKRSDIFVIRDEVLFTDRDFHHRNKIRINGKDNLNGPQSKWLKVPINDPKDYIMHVDIDNSKPWSDKLLNEIEINYKKAPYFNNFYPPLVHIFKANHDKLLDLNIKLISFLKKSFGLDTKVILASSLNLKPAHYQKSDASLDIVKICEKVSADSYLSGDGGKGYLDTKPFESANIRLFFQEYKHPVYEQAYPGFLPYMCALDALFCQAKIPV